MKRTRLFTTVLFLLLVLGWPGTAWSADWYVSPSGSDLGDGSQENPWDLQTALNHPATVFGGDTIWLYGGTYEGQFNSLLNGFDENFPIVVREMPGERAIVQVGPIAYQQAALRIIGTYTWFQDFEITTSGGDRVATSGTWPDLDDMNTGNGVEAGRNAGEGVGCKLIDLTIHDCAHGVLATADALNFEVTGCLLYFNGYQGNTDANGLGSSYGVALDMDNDTAGAKLLQDNIIFGTYSFALQAWGPSTQYQNNLTYRGNTVFDSGIMTTSINTIDTMLGGGSPMTNFVFADNMMYRRTLTGVCLNVGDAYYTGIYNDANVQGNYIVGESRLRYWQTLIFRHNTLVAPRSLVDPLETTGVAAVPAYDWNFNTYYCAQISEWGNYHPFTRYYEDANGTIIVNNTRYLWDAWRTTTGYDANSSYTVGYPTTTQVFVRQGQYDDNRINITIFNWAASASVAVDVSAVLSEGESYEVRDVQNITGTPVASGTYSGTGTISIPMTGTDCVQPYGNAPVAWTHTPMQFNAFILTAGVASNAAPTANAGADAAAMMPVGWALAGSMSDDGIPAACTATWSKVSGPGTVTFANPNALNTKATYSARGTYVLRLTASDSALSATDDVTVTVLRAGDFTNDNLVDGLDFLNWQSHYPNFIGGATADGGDGNGDGKVDGLDFLVWQSNYGG